MKRAKVSVDRQLAGELQEYKEENITVLFTWSLSRTLRLIGDAYCAESL